MMEEFIDCPHLDNLSSINHRLEEVEAVATHVAMIDGGKIVEMGTVDEFFHHPQTERLKAFLAAYRRQGGSE